jgi:hypothetical protein
MTSDQSCQEQCGVSKSFFGLINDELSNNFSTNGGGRVSIIRIYIQIFFLENYLLLAEFPRFHQKKFPQKNSNFFFLEKIKKKNYA